MLAVSHEAISPGAAAPLGGLAVSIDKAMRELLRDVVRDVVRDELCTLLGEPAGTVPDAEPGTSSEFVSAKAAATIADVSEETVRVWVRRGMLPAHWAGRLLRVKRDELEHFMAAAGGDKEDGIDADKFAKQVLATKG